MVQWLRLYLSMQRVWLWSLVGELRCHMPCSPLPPKKTNLKQKQYCNKVNTKPLKMVHIKKKRNLYQSLIHITTLYHLNHQPPQTASHSLNTVYFRTSMPGFNALPYPLRSSLFQLHLPWFQRQCWSCFCLLFSRICPNLILHLSVSFTQGKFFKGNSLSDSSL